MLVYQRVTHMIFPYSQKYDVSILRNIMCIYTSHTYEYIPYDIPILTYINIY